MLTLAEKRTFLCSFPEFREIRMSNGRFNYELQNLVTRRRIVAREFSATGNGYVLGTSETVFPVDERGWINVKNLDESQLRQTVRHAINALKALDFKLRCSRLLTEGGLLPLTSPAWRHFELLHQPPTTQDESDCVRQAIEREVGNANGLYIYVKPDGTVLYVGKAKPLRNRLWSHYLESFRTVQVTQRTTDGTGSFRHIRAKSLSIGESWRMKASDNLWSRCWLWNSNQSSLPSNNLVEHWGLGVIEANASETSAKEIAEIVCHRYGGDFILFGKRKIRLFCGGTELELKSQVVV